MGLIFDENTANSYDSWCRSLQGRTIDNAVEQLILSLLDPKPRERVLDIGCGAGNHLLIFNKLGLDVSGIDASGHMIKKAKERLGHRCTLKRALAEDLPFDDNEFDLVVFINTLEYLDDPLQALREAGRVASKKVFIGVINSLSFNGFKNRFQGYLGDPLFSHAKSFNLWQLTSLLQRAYGPAPVSWSCIETGPSFIEKIIPFKKSFANWKHFPFGPFLGISATMTYRVKTDNIPLKIKLKKAAQPLIDVKTLEDQP